MSFANKGFAYLKACVYYNHFLVFWHVKFMLSDLENSVARFDEEDEEIFEVCMRYCL
jgi:hypothetical protein